MSPQLKDFLKALGVALAMVAVIIIANSCSCNYHLNKVAKKCPSLTVKDSIVVRDTVLIHATETATVFSSSPNDTIYINKDRLKIKYVKLPGDSVFISGKCDTVKVFFEKKVYYEKKVYKAEWLRFIRTNINWILLITILILIIIFGIRRLTK